MLSPLSLYWFMLLSLSLSLSVMSSRTSWLSVPLFLFLLGPQRIDSAEAPPLSLPLPSLSGAPPPEVDGSAVDDPCRILPVTTPSAITMTTPPNSRKQALATPKKSADQSPPRKPIFQNTGAPVVKQPSFRTPVTNSISTPGSRLLYYLLANSRRPLVNSFQGVPGYWLLPVSQPIGGRPHGTNAMTSQKTLLKRAKKTYLYTHTHPARHTHSLSHTQRQTGSSSSEEFNYHKF